MITCGYEGKPNKGFDSIVFESRAGIGIGEPFLAGPWGLVLFVKPVYEYFVFFTE